MDFQKILLALAVVLGAGPEGHAQLIREANTTLTLPAEPPRSGYRLETAFPGLRFTDPVAIVVPPGETNRLFVVEQAGRIAVITNLANPNRSVFLDLTARIVAGGEQGLLGLAFHPGHATNGFFYVFYTVNTTTAAGTGLHDRLSRFRTHLANPHAGDPASEFVLLSQRDEASNHNGGDLHFGPDGYLYVSLGDEGAGDDTLNNSQRIDKDFFAGILRIDVDQRPGSLAPNPHAANTNAAGVIHYAIPPDNPFVGTNRFNNVAVNPSRVRTEFWAVGLRNPWRMSFDRDSGLLYAADVGQGAREEVNIIMRGGNYGWNYREGTRSGPRTAPAGLTFNPPFLEYNHGSATNQGRSVTGGVVYRGSRLSQLYGHYLFADYVSGNVWATRYSGTNNPPFVRLTADGGIAGFGLDPRNGDVLTADQSDDTLKRLVDTGAPTGTPLPATLAETGAFTDLSLLTPAAGVVPYEINVPFWSDRAKKDRWFSLPRLSDTIAFSPEGNASFPTGMVWIKHFELELTPGVPESSRRLETRFLVRNEAGVYGLTYRWDEDGRNARLVPEEGLDESIAIMEGGVVRTQVWHYPGRGECLACHTAAGGWALSFTPAQLNRDRKDGEVVTNQLVALARAGYLGAADPDPRLFPRLAAADDEGASVTARVRSYLAANCAPCHQPGGGAIGLFDARFSTPNPLAGLIDGPLNDPGVLPGSRVVVPGVPELSQLLARISLRGPGQMPPIASNERDVQSIDLLQRWITRTLAGYEPVTMPFADWQGRHFGTSTAPAAAAAADPDGDALSNRLEYLLETDPGDRASTWGLAAVVDDGNIWMELSRRPNRGLDLVLEEATDPQGPWHTWTAEVNDRVFSSAPGVARFGPVIPEAAGKFYRLRAIDQDLD